MNSIKKLALAVTVISLFSTIAVNAQSGDTLVIPESYQQTQEQLDEPGSAGTTSYNIDDTTPESDPGSGSWRSEAEGEELKLYSGSHDGNNYVKTIKVKAPANGSSTYRNEYKPN